MLASVLQQALVEGLERRDNGVRQRRFAVLWRSAKPSALVELMYMNWQSEGDLLRLPKTRERAAQALFTALRWYFEGRPLQPADAAGPASEAGWAATGRTD
jgi:N-acetylmuramoyl-L-alanine amidase